MSKKMIEKVINRRNMQLAYLHVLRNKGSSGVDGMAVKELGQYVKEYGETKYQIVVSEKRWKTLKEKLKTITRKTTMESISERIEKLKEVQRGWINYFRIGNIYGKLKALDSWVRNRLRYCIWHNWKKRERRRKNFIRLGIDQDKAYQWSRTRMGGWRKVQLW